MGAAQGEDFPARGRIEYGNGGNATASISLTDSGAIASASARARRVFDSVDAGRRANQGPDGVARPIRLPNA